MIVVHIQIIQRIIKISIQKVQIINNICEAGRLYRFFVDKRHLEIRGDLGGGDNDEDVNEDDEEMMMQKMMKIAGRRYVGGSVW